MDEGRKANEKRGVFHCCPQNRELIKEALSCSEYWGKKGGITVSGGEPLSQIDFLIELFTKAKD